MLLQLLIAAGLHTAPLRVVQFTVNDTLSYNVNSELIVGPTEAILVDCGFYPTYVKREVDSIASLGVHLKAIIITHPDEDHYFGAVRFVERFPGTPVYMTPAGIERFNTAGPKFLAMVKKQYPQMAPDSMATPTPFPGDGLTVDGERIEIHPDEQGDVLKPTNSFFWIPSIKTVIAGDIVFNKVHAYFAATDAPARQRWHRSIAHIKALHARVVIAGHKSPDAIDSPAVLDAMDRYITDFDAAHSSSPNEQALAAVMMKKYPDWTVPLLLRYSAHTAYDKPID